MPNLLALLYIFLCCINWFLKHWCMHNRVTVNVVYNAIAILGPNRIVLGKCLRPSTVCTCTSWIDILFCYRFISRVSQSLCCYWAASIPALKRLTLCSHMTQLSSLIPAASHPLRPSSRVGNHRAIIWTRILLCIVLVRCFVSWGTWLSIFRSINPLPYWRYV